ncbi:MAG: hypothetical protein GY696_01345 [Gammaproteobacteria bacterium]|nr:hypothetical protein [Gammaproteobacteria bacterium]
MRYTFTRLALLLAVLTLVTGCKTIGEMEQSNKLNDALRRYAASIRWTHLDQAYGYLKPDLAAETEYPEDEDNIKVTSYEVVRPPIQTDETHAIQTARIEFVFIDRQVVRKIIDNQQWEYMEEEKSWMRANPIPEFK